MSDDLSKLVEVAENAYEVARLPNEVLSQRTISAMVQATRDAIKPPSEEEAIRRVAMAYGFTEEEAALVHEKRLRRLLVDFDAMRRQAQNQN